MLTDNILVIDDDESNLIAVEAALAPLGRPIVRARSGFEALKRMLEQDFALVLLDISMPGMNGFETARMMRSRERNRMTPIVFITGSEWKDEEIVEGYELGVFDFMFKPVRPELLRAKAQVFLDLQERTAELRRVQALAYEHELDAQRREFEARELESKLRQHADDDRRKDEFLAILAHELRNPLQPLQTGIDMMREHPDEPLPMRTQAILAGQLQHLNRLVDDLLDVTRLSEGKLVLHRTTVDLAEVIDDAVAATRPSTDARRQVVTVTPPESSESTIVRGDHVRLVQALSNLLGNAAKFTHPGGNIEITWGVRGDFAFVRVTDNGRGIRPNLLPTIFDMFVQERVTSDGAGGLGLGLALVKRIVELHDGRVLAASGGEGAGSTFQIEIPHAMEARSVATPRRSTGGAGSSEPPERPLRMVVCDDAPDIRELVGDMLTRHGHQVTTVADGRSAIAMIVSDTPDVALIDIGLPDIDGYEVAREVRRALPGHTPRLIAVTGYGQPKDRETALAAGFDAHIVKPASTAKIMAALKAADLRPVLS